MVSCNNKFIDISSINGSAGGSLGSELKSYAIAICVKSKLSFPVPNGNFLELLIPSM